MIVLLIVAVALISAAYGVNFINYAKAKKLIGQCEVRRVLTGHGRNIVTLKNGDRITISTILPFTDFSFPVANTPVATEGGLSVGGDCTPLYMIQ